MPLPLIPLIAAGSALAGQGINAAATAANNRKSRLWSEKMYKQQRQDAIADFTMQNEYNSPTAQMKRLREAGLNPNLVYGNGAQSASAQVRSSSVESYNPQPLQFSPESVTGAYFDTSVRQAQTDNLTQQNSNMKAQEDLIRAQIIATLANAATSGTTKTKLEQDIASGQFDLQMRKLLQENTIQVANQNLEKMKADTSYTLDQNERAAAMQAPNLQKAIEEILTLRANRQLTGAQKAQVLQTIENLKKDGKLKDYEISLNKDGIQKGDALWQRQVFGAANSIWDTITDPKNPTSKKMSNIFQKTPGYHILKKMGIYQ